MKATNVHIDVHWHNVEVEGVACHVDPLSPENPDAYAVITIESDGATIRLYSETEGIALFVKSIQKALDEIKQQLKP